ncbi:hypothetical protein GCM10011395_09940 [Sphingomonas psychrolutea]|uniref:Uncharacterized protein n=1 Tax=Sphingomonas psychrolutea TaxID=1259676 RepID=A0ABQ1GDL6_9SPHN|nr:hypothetical protein GCM10011395_09940 [Sphingomonas psychrolutea]
MAVEQGEAANTKPGDEPCHRDLRRITRAADHAFAKKGAAERNAVKPARQQVAFPHLDRMREAHGVELVGNAFDRRIDPGIGTVGERLRAKFKDLWKGVVGGDAETVADERLS